MGFRRLVADNFCGFQHFELKLNKRGLVWLGGDNRDTESSSSNGSGKSTVFKAIMWAAWGESIDGADGDEVIREGQKSAETFLTLDGKWTVKRIRRKGSPKLHLFDPAGNPVEGSREELQARINELLGMDFHSARNIILYGQRDSKRFIHPDTPDKDRKEILHSILRTALYSGAHKWAKDQALALKRKGDEIQARIDKAKARIAEHDISELEAEEKAWDEKRRESVRNIKLSAQKFIEDAKRLSEETPDTVALALRVTKLREWQDVAKKCRPEVERLRASWTKARDEEVSAAAKETAALNRYKAAVENEVRVNGIPDDVCAECGGPISAAKALHRRQKAKAEREVAEAEYRKLSGDPMSTAVKSAREAHDAKRRELSEAEAQIAKLETAPEDLAAAKSLKERAKSLKERARDELNRARATGDAPNPHTAALVRAREKIAAAEREVKKETEEALSVASERAHMQFWILGFSPTGLPSFVLDSIMPYLTERTNHYLEVLADGDITMHFTSQRELRSAKGEFRDEIGISWEIEGVEDYPPSGGQWKKMEIATQFALMDLVATREGATPDLLLLDECLDGLDEPGRARVLTLLHTLRKTRGTIMVVSHESDMAEIFERSITVVKSGGVASLEAA